MYKRQAEDAALFTQRADRLAQQYSDIIVVDSVHANGRFTLGENIADQGGLMLSLIHIFRPAGRSRISARLAYGFQR